MSEPIVLTAEQQAFVGQRLKHLLEKNYRVINQSDDKIAHSVAYLMGYDHAHQRDALEQTPTKDPVWAFTFLAERDYELPTQKRDTLLSLGWFEVNEPCEYLDFEIEHSYAPRTETSPRYSFNFKVTFDYSLRQVYIAFGENRGAGFDPYVDWCVERNDPATQWHEVISSLEHSENVRERIIYQTLMESPELRDDLLESLTQLYHWLHH